MGKRSFTLPGGYVDDAGLVHREADLRPLSGREEELLAQTLTGPPTAALVTEVLTRCVERIGDHRPVTADMARRLLAGDREYLLLKLRALTFGDRVCATISCPWPDCGQRVDVDFSISDVPVTERVPEGLVHEIELPAETVAESGWDPKLRRLRFRLPNGEDQETVAPILARNEAEALTRLLSRCIESFGDARPSSDALIEELPPLARLEIERQMESRAPKVDLVMEARCPECGREFAAPFQLQDFFFGELRTSRDLLYRELHYLAYHYHWSEADIMAMSRGQRRNYISVLADEIERLNDAVA